MEKELVINDTPFIRILPQYAYLDAIINNQNTNTDLLCSLYVKGLRGNEWTFHIDEGEVQVQNETVDLYRKGYGVKTRGGWYHYVQKDDEVIFHIQYQQYTNRWDSVNFFLDTDEKFVFSNDLNCSYKFCIHCCGDFRIDVNEEVVFYKSNKESWDIFGWYKVKIKQEKVILYASADGEKWTMLYEAWAPEMHACRNLVGGFYINLHNNQYHKWLCNNFLQIRYDPIAEDMGYSALLNRDWKSHAIHPLVKFSYDKKDMIMHWGLWEYIVTNINSKRYLEIWLDEYYVEGLEAYRKYSYNHESLIYGYDEHGGKVRMLSIVSGKPTRMAISIETVSMAWQKAAGNNTIIKTFEYLPDEAGYELDVNHIIAQMKNYMNGYNCSVEYQYLAERENGVFGINIYDAILESVERKDKFLSDKRIAYLIKEHKECMRFRIQYLFEKGHLETEAYKYLLNKINNIIEKANIILFLVLKNIFAAKETITDSIWEYLNCLKKEDTEFCEFFVELLEGAKTQGYVWGEGDSQKLRNLAE